VQSQYAFDLLDGAVVSFPEGAKKPRTRQLHVTKGAAALTGAFWGFLFGLIFFVPLLGLTLGAGLGALVAALANFGIDDDFIEQVRAEVKPGTSALFLYTQHAGSATDSSTRNCTRMERATPATRQSSPATEAGLSSGSSGSTKT
jgi:uncharacterized membrane protein